MQSLESVQIEEKNTFKNIVYYLIWSFSRELFFYLYIDEHVLFTQIFLFRVPTCMYLGEKVF